MKIKSIVQKVLLSFISIINFLFFYFFSKFNKIRVNYLNNLGKCKVIVIAPHFDDDMIGCGGTICNFVNYGATVKIIYLTDGSKSEVQKRDNKSLIEIRKKEAKNAAVIAELFDLVFLDYPDGRLEEYKSELIRYLKELIEEFNPDIVFVPFIIDWHIDHRVISKILPAILPNNVKIFCYNAEYGLSDIFINIVSKISKKIKVELLNCYKSQSVNFKGIIRYEELRSYLFSREYGYYEAFFCCDLNTYNKLLKSVENKSEDRELNNLTPTSEIYKMVLGFLGKRRIEKRVFKDLKF